MPRKRTGSTPTTETAPSSPKRTARTRKTTTAPKTTRRTKTAAVETLSADERRERIAITAYYRAQARGFQPGFEVEDWLDAERTVDEEFARA